MLSGLYFSTFGWWHLQTSLSSSTCSCQASSQWNTTSALAPIQRKILKTSSITSSPMLSTLSAFYSTWLFRLKSQSISIRTSPKKKQFQPSIISAMPNSNLWLIWRQVSAPFSWWEFIWTLSLLRTDEIRTCWTHSQSEFTSLNFFFQLSLDLQ